MHTHTFKKVSPRKQLLYMLQNKLIIRIQQLHLFINKNVMYIALGSEVLHMKCVGIMVGQH